MAPEQTDHGDPSIPAERIADGEQVRQGENAIPVRKHSRIGAVVRDQMWQFIGVVVAVLLFFVGYLQTRDDEPKPAREPSVGVTGNVDGTCNGVGVGVSIRC